MTIKAEYTFIKSQLKKSLIVNDRLSAALASMEKKVEAAVESVEYLTKKADEHIRSRNEIITELQRRLAKKIKANGKEPTDQKLNVETEDKEKQ
jgi:hypothetical protein|tara:strand:+ start:623 stop:904 length:282 start_codon:yes stop_codon:yes gene_type:complete